MKAMLTGGLGLWLAAGAAVVAADFWEAKPFTAWSEKEIGRMLTDSPWSRPVAVLTQDLSLANRVGGLQGGRIGGRASPGRPGGGGGVGGDGAGDLGGGSFMPAPRSTRLIVRWASALPVRQAAARVRNGTDEDTTLATGSPPQLEGDEPFYRVVVVGVPFALPVGVAGELQDATFLKRRNARPIEPADIRFVYEGELLTIEFLFPRADAITVRDKVVEFETRLGESAIKGKFRLDKMILGDRLAL